MNKRYAYLLIAAAILLAGCSTPEAPATPEGPTPTPHGEMLPRVEVVASSETAFGASRAIDGALNSYWGSEPGVPQWIYVDLGDSFAITRVVVHWFKVLSGTVHRPSYATIYEIQVSDDAENWTMVRRVDDGDGGTDDFTGLSVTGRYVRMYAIELVNEGGDKFSILEFEVYGEGAAAD